jgi:hypothetical protein
MIEVSDIVSYLYQSGQDCDSRYDTETLAEMIMDRLTNDDPTCDEINDLIHTIHADYRASL